MSEQFVDEGAAFKAGREDMFPEITRLSTKIGDLVAENAHLQERVEAAEEAREAEQSIADRYKALAERRKKLLSAVSRSWHNFRHTEIYRETELTWEDCTEETCVADRAAIEEGE